MNSPDLTTDLIDLDELTARCMGRMELVERILTKFQSTLAADLTELEGAIRRRDSDEIVRHAHRIKGSSGSVAARGLRDSAERLETLAAEAEYPGIEQLIEEMRSEFARLSQAISVRHSEAS